MVKFIRYSKLFRLYETIQPFLKYSLNLEEKLPAHNILVIAPHMDDEVIGCGGTVCAHVKRGGKAGVVYCTGKDETRKKEAAAAAQLIGFEKQVFMDHAVESLAGNGKFVSGLAEVISAEQPEIVFLPFILDNHSDHRAVNEALITIANNSKHDFMVYAYPVWFPVYPNVLIDIGDTWDIKKKAINCYASQTATRDYVKMSHSLGQYWAAVKGKNIEVAESFFKATLSEYVKLGDKVLK